MPSPQPSRAPSRLAETRDQPFHSVEEAWFWTMAALIARRDGARIVSGAGLVARPCEPDDVIRCLDRLYRQRRIDLQHARIMRLWGERGEAPDPRSPREAGDWRLWSEAMRRLDWPLRVKGIVTGPLPLAKPADILGFPGPGRVMRAAHRRGAAQQVFIVFGDGADQPWLRLLRPGFRHCFAAIADEAGWTVLDPLTGRLVVSRLGVPLGFDLPGFYRRAGLLVLGPFLPGEPRARRLPPLEPVSCVALCWAVLGDAAPFAVTPFGLFLLINKMYVIRKNVLTDQPPLSDPGGILVGHRSHACS